LPCTVIKVGPCVVTQVKVDWDRIYDSNLTNNINGDYAKELDIACLRGLGESNIQASQNKLWTAMAKETWSI